jgi:hypothetical protein
MSNESIEPKIFNQIHEAPIELATQGQNGKLVINQNALEILRTLEGNIAVCSVVGPYRTG